MATLVLAAAGSAMGGALGGSVAGLTTAVIGKAVGATLGSVIDQKLMGAGAEPVETGRVDRFRFMGSSEGSPLPRVFGRMRTPGQIIWSSRFYERVSSEEVGGKGGGGGGTTVEQFSYSVSLAVALCEGEILRIGRIWADGQPLDQSGMTIRVHAGAEDQLPDPLISAIEGSASAPAYRGTSYVVFENLELGPFGNRIPQFNVEVFRRTAKATDKGSASPFDSVRGVALVPGSGEYALATEPVYLEKRRGETQSANVHNDLGAPDIVASLDQMSAELPQADAISLVVSWFGDDLRCDRCSLRPMVEQNVSDGNPMRWRVSGLARQDAREITRVDGKPLFGGTPCDASVIQAIQHARAIGKKVMFYPFIMMDVPSGNSLKDPWSGAGTQPVVPWRGRITTSKAPGQSGSPDGTPAASDEVRAFFGTANAADFNRRSESVDFDGDQQWSYRRFVLHYAHLCAQAGGVEAFCIGSEMRALTQVRDGSASYPAVQQLVDLADEVRSVLGPDAKIGYAADWSEYFGHQPTDGSGDVIYHLDPLWAHDEIDFVGIDNYMPLSDWRDGSNHADADAGSIYDLDYLRGNVAGGEGYDWYYPDQAARDAQARTPISDGAYGEDWVFRYKDLENWWANRHENRIGGVKTGAPTDWRPGMKPVWFTELGCPAVNKGTNQPNVFYDPKSSESFFPYFSNGVRDDFIQQRYLDAVLGHWSDADNNPVSSVYGGRMVDLSHAYVWAWDARPWPDFPYRNETWVDGENYARGHWLNGRTSAPSLANVVGEICASAELVDIDVNGLSGRVTGYSINDVESARQSLQPLMLAYGFDSFARGENLAFADRSGRIVSSVSSGDCVYEANAPVVARARGPGGEAPGRVALAYVRSDLDYQSGATEATSRFGSDVSVAQSSVAVVLSDGEAKAVAERWLSESEIARDGVELSLPPSSLDATSGDVIALETDDDNDLFRIDRIEEIGPRKVTAIRVEPQIYDAPIIEEKPAVAPAIPAATPAYPVFLDLPLLTGDEVAHAPHLAVAKSPWTGPLAVFSANEDAGYKFNQSVRRPAVIGETLSSLAGAEAGLWTENAIDVRILSGVLQSRSPSEVLGGANAAAIRGSGGADWEVIQFRDAVLVSPQTYRLTGLLRGQAGTDQLGEMQAPIGSEFVLLDGAIAQLEMPSSARGLDRHYRVGPASRPYDDASYTHHVEAFRGVGLRPYRPTHGEARRGASGDVSVGWIRRTRVDGDSWEGAEVPLGEEREIYHVVAKMSGKVLREAEVTAANWSYDFAAQSADGATGPMVFEVAQISDRFGPGPYLRIPFDG